MKTFYTIVLTLVAISTSVAKDMQLSASLIDNSKVADDGLYFNGTKYDANTNPTGNYEYSLNYELSTNNNTNLEQRIIAYPNPTENSFEINVPKYFDIVKQEVYNCHGQLIASKTETINNGKVSLDISDKANGIYFVKVNLDKPVYVKVIKK